jgi:hypothetical protein
MTKKTKKELYTQACVLAGVVGGEHSIPIVLRILLHGYYLGLGYSVTSAAQKASKLAVELEATHDSK